MIDIEQTKASKMTNPSFSISVPKIITIDSLTKKGAYRVGVKGNFEKGEITITTPNSFLLKEQNASVDKKDNVTAHISKPKITWTQDDINMDTYMGTTGIIEAADISAGSWKGSFDFSIVANIAEIETVTYTGMDFNAAVKTLANHYTCDHKTEDYQVTGFKVTHTPPSEDIKSIPLGGKIIEGELHPDITVYMDGNTAKIYTENEKIMLPEDSSYMFNTFKGLTETLDLSDFDASTAKNMNHMFAETGFSSMHTLKLGDSFNTENVTDMSDMFLFCGYHSLKTLDLGDNFHTENVTDMRRMFKYCGYNCLTELNLTDNFCPEKVTDMQEMFSNCGFSSMTSLDLGNSFDTKNVTNMKQMFLNCGFNSLKAFDLKNKFDTTKVTNMQEMFHSCGQYSMRNLRLGELFNTENVTNMNSMFQWCGYLMEDFNLGPQFSLKNVEDTENIFDHCGSETCIIKAPADIVNELNSIQNNRIIQPDR